MSLVINTNVSALNTARQLDQSSNAQAKSLQRLSSGLRINNASDDAAGLGISTRMTSQIRGTNQSIRNANDGISMLQVSEGALQEVGNILQRMRELSIQASNDTYGSSDLETLQKEISQLLQEINRINDTTSFGDTKLFAGQSGEIFDPRTQPIIDGLKSFWLNEAEALIQSEYGLSAGGGPDLEVVFYEGALGGVAASIGSSYSGGLDFNNLSAQTLNIDIQDFIPANLPNGGTAPVYNDRIIAHEMVHAVMARTVDLNQLRTDTNSWFTEGAAEFIHGADERLSADLTSVGSTAGLLAKLGDGTTEGTYGAGYAAVAYMHSSIKVAGGEGMKDVFTYLSSNPLDTLDDALSSVNATLGGLWASQSAFETDLQGAAGQAFVNSMDLSNQDVGAIGGLDADGGSVKTAESILPNNGSFSDNPTALNVVIPDNSGSPGSRQIAFQVGYQASQTINVSISGFSVNNLSLGSLDVSVNASTAILAIDRALEFIVQSRGTMGAVQNRLELTISNLSNTALNISQARSRIMDADYAIEVSTLIRNQILLQAGQSMMAQANSSPELILSLLT
jgi:flagellin